MNVVEKHTKRGIKSDGRNPMSHHMRESPSSLGELSTDILSALKIPPSHWRDCHFADALLPY